jgi:hypothetical protein
LDIDSFEKRLVKSGESLYSICKVCRIITTILDLDELIERLIDWVITDTNADRGVMVLQENDKLAIKKSN